MNEKNKIAEKIRQIDFAMYELNLFLDSNPNNERAIRLLESYRKAKANLIKDYEEKYGAYIVTFDDVPAKAPFSWTKGPWPWEREFNGEREM